MIAMLVVIGVIGVVVVGVGKLIVSIDVLLLGFL